MGRKSTDIEVQERIESIRDEMLKGMVSRVDLLQFITKNYKVSEPQADKDIARAKELIKEAITNTERDFLIAQSIERLNNLYYKNYRLQDYRECRQLVVEINKMFGLNAPEKLEVKDTSDGRTKDQIDERINQLLERRASRGA